MVVVKPVKADVLAAEPAGLILAPALHDTEHEVDGEVGAVAHCAHDRGGALGALQSVILEAEERGPHALGHAVLHRLQRCGKGGVLEQSQLR